MSDSVNEILGRIHLQPNNLKNATPQIVQKIFSNLSIGQISRLCQTSRSFNFVCREESLWKSKLWSDYGVEIKNTETWREEAKIVFLESEQFWETINGGIDYFMTNGMNYLGDSKVDFDLGDKARYFVNKFEKNLVDHALREGKEFYATELIFRSFYNTERYIDNLEDDGYYVNFILLFEKVAELSPGGKISLKWVLSLNHIQEDKFAHFHKIHLSLNPTIEHDKEQRGHMFYLYNRDLFRSMESLALLYMNHQNLFMDDTTDDQSDIVSMLNHWENFVF